MARGLPLTTRAGRCLPDWSLTMTTKPLDHHTVGSVRWASTMRGGASALAVVHIDGPDGQPAGTIVADLHDDHVTNAAAALMVDAMSGLRWHLAAVETAREHAARADAARASAHRAERASADRLQRALTGRSSVFGEVLVTVSADGTAWLQDPQKGDAGFGLHFTDLPTLWRCHPELRPVRWDDGRLVCAALALG